MDVFQYVCSGLYTACKSRRIREKAESVHINMTCERLRLSEADPSISLAIETIALPGGEFACGKQDFVSHFEGQQADSLSKYIKFEHSVH